MAAWPVRETLRDGDAAHHGTEADAVSPKPKRALRWGVILALTLAMAATMALFTAGVRVGARLALEEQPGQQPSVALPGQLFWCPQQSDTRTHALEQRVLDFASGPDALWFLRLDAWGDDEAVVLGSDRVHSIALQEAMRLLRPAYGEARGPDASRPVQVSAPLSAALIGRIQDQVARSLMQARSRQSFDRLQDQVLHGDELRVRVAGWLCADASDFPDGSAAGDLYRLMAALGAHSRLSDPEALEASAGRLQNLLEEAD
ncbi:MAG: hypothetical protein KF823_01090 [Xanthomonadales bacterium]|nr:hypothetical protein [Xanthomonadales bacterium]